MTKNLKLRSCIQLQEAFDTHLTLNEAIQKLRAVQLQPNDEIECNGEKYTVIYASNFTDEKIINNLKGFIDLISDTNPDEKFTDEDFNEDILWTWFSQFFEDPEPTNDYGVIAIKKEVLPEDANFDEIVEAWNAYWWKHGTKNPDFDYAIFDGRLDQDLIFKLPSEETVPYLKKEADGKFKFA